jgi:hypothetical protein
MAGEGPRCDCGCVNTFTSKSAEGDLKRYLDKGPDGTTRMLVTAIRSRGIDGATLLDVGAGIGAVQWELLANGVRTSQSVDASEGYAAIVRREAERRGLADRVTVRQGTLEELADAVDGADIVTLDRVICSTPRPTSTSCSASPASSGGSSTEPSSGASPSTSAGLPRRPTERPNGRRGRAQGMQNADQNRLTSLELFGSPNGTRPVVLPCVSCAAAHRPISPSSHVLFGVMTYS